jgi:hypothetical protein
MLKGYFDAAVSNTSSAAFMTDHMSTICGNADCKEMYSNGTDQLDAFCDIYDHCGEDMVTDSLDMIAESNGSTTSSAAQAGFVADHASTICGSADCKEAWSNNTDDEGQEELNALCDIHDHCGESSEDMLADMYTINMTAGFNDSDPNNETIRAFYIDNAIAVCGSADCKQAHHDGGLPAGAVEIMEEVCADAETAETLPAAVDEAQELADDDAAAGQVILIVATVVPIVGVCCIGVCIGLFLYAAAARPPANSPTPHPPPARPRARRPTAARAASAGPSAAARKRRSRPTPPTARASRSGPEGPSACPCTRTARRVAPTTLAQGF